MFHCTDAFSGHVQCHHRIVLPSCVFWHRQCHRPLLHTTKVIFLFHLFISHVLHDVIQIGLLIHISAVILVLFPVPICKIQTPPTVGTF